LPEDEEEIVGGERESTQPESWIGRAGPRGPARFLFGPEARPYAATVRPLIVMTLLLLAAPAARSAVPPSATVASAADDFDAGQRHYARGEYRQAAERFALAAARVEPALKPRARYWAGLAWLGAGESTQARAAFEDVIESGAPEVPLARLGVALCWEAEKRPDRAEETLARMVTSDMGEAGATTLAHLAALAHARGDVERERRASDRLVREYAGSMEAAQARVEVSRAPAAPQMVWVQIGAFGDPARARALAETARRAGLGEATVRAQETGQTRLQVVLLGPYRSEDEARRGAAQASERLGTPARIARTP
jgi:tetratricopeptide (TPR) repeat protein